MPAQISQLALEAVLEAEGPSDGRMNGLVMEAVVESAVPSRGRMNGLWLEAVVEDALSVGWMGQLFLEVVVAQEEPGTGTTPVDPEPCVPAAPKTVRTLMDPAVTQ